MKVVLDTNIVVSGLLRIGGNPFQALTLALTREIIPCLSEKIFAEYEEVLARPRFAFDPARVRETLDSLRANGVWVEGSPTGLTFPDADDETFIIAALAADADYVVTGNLAHFPKGEYERCKVVSPAEFMRLWKERGERAP